MKNLHYLLVIIFWMFFSVSVKAQDDSHGNVVLHSDPRLGLLLKKSHPFAKATTAEKNRPIARLSAAVETGHPAARLSAAAETSHPVAKVPVGAETGHVITGTPAPVTSTPAIEKNNIVANAAPGVTTMTAPKNGTLPPPRFVTERLTTTEKPRVIYSGKGFRVQIYNGQDRNKAMEIKMEFMRRYPNLRTYLTYMSPCFRVKVGNYRNRSDAEGMYREARSMYSPCMIVPDIITISTF